ncbi:MAG: hypothetical protein H7A24_09690 [Leptospiraceae bacterium]|nr:hypothetical protein [Leptospiraceae bacterium]MCP5512143.1 hypothetical protein [Leptospiraceae bacterium]
MEKLKTLVILIGISILAILTFSLSKSWFIYENRDRGIEINEPDTKSTVSVVKKIEYSDALSSDSKILWKNFIYFPHDLNKEESDYGQDNVLHHAKNLTFINLTTGKIRKVFEKKVYIWDYFTGESIKKSIPFPGSEPIEDTIDVGQKVVILAMTRDSNGDGFLNQKDNAEVFVYDPSEEKLISILPEGYYFEKFLYNSRKNQLVSIIKKNHEPKSPPTPSAVFSYDVNLEKGILIELESVKK